jgi:hypothetical protein
MQPRIVESNVFAGAGRHDERGHPQASAAYITEDDLGGAVHQRQLSAFSTRASSGFG